MTVEKQDIVTLDHYGKRRMGVVLQVGIVPGGAAVAIGVSDFYTSGAEVIEQPPAKWLQEQLAAALEAVTAYTKRAEFLRAELQRTQGEK